MKKTSTKLLSVLAAGVIMASAFAGCGGNSSSTASGDNSSNAGSSNTSAFDTSKSLSVITREQGSGTRDAFVELTGVLVKDGGTKTDTTRTDAVTVNGTEAVITNVRVMTQQSVTFHSAHLTTVLRLLRLKMLRQQQKM